MGGVSQVWTRYEGRQGWSRAHDSRCRVLACIPPPAEMQQGRPSLCCVSTIRSLQGPPEPGEGGCRAWLGGCRAGPGGCGADGVGGRCCVCIPSRRAQPLAQQKRSRGDGGWPGAHGCCCVQGTGRRGEPVSEASPVSLRGASPGAALLRGSSAPILPLLQNAPTCPGSAPPTLTHV